MRFGGGVRYGSGTRYGSRSVAGVIYASVTFEWVTSLDAVASKIASDSATMVAEGSLVASGQVVKLGSATMLADAVIEASGQRIQQAGATMLMDAALEVNATRILAGSAIFLAETELSAQVARILNLGAFTFDVATEVQTAGTKIVTGTPTAMAGIFSLEGSLVKVVLEAEDALFYWEPGVMLTPVVGDGDGIFGRDSSATVGDRRGIMRSVITNIPRIDWVVEDGLVRQAMRLERAGLNKHPRNVDFAANGTAGWVASSGTITAVGDAVELAAAGLTELVPDATVLRLTNPGPGAADFYLAGATQNTTTAHTFSVFARGAPVTVGIGAQRASFAESVSYRRIRHTANSNGSLAVVGIPAAGSVYVVLHQLEEGPMSSVIRNPTAGSMVRSSERMAWSRPPRPQKFTSYASFYAEMDADGGLSLPRIFEYGQLTDSGARVSVRLTPTGLSALVSNGTSTQTTALPVTVLAGEFVEVVLYLNTDGSGRLIVSVEGQAAIGATLPAVTGGLGASWERLWINSGADTGVGQGLYRRLSAVTGLQNSSDEGRMGAMRNFVMAPNGALLRVAG